MTSCFLEDGYSVETLIPAAPGLYPAVRLRYRPALAEERLAFIRSAELAPPEQARRVVDLIKRHVESWDAKNRQGHSVDLTAEAVRRLQPGLQSAILDLILGYTPAEEARDAGN